ncbi:MAG: hypothetical protein KIT76_03610 [Pseudolabrys sp.]|nr:hypothetical protein [Pseudolabrys sp.]
MPAPNTSGVRVGKIVRCCSSNSKTISKTIQQRDAHRDAPASARRRQTVTRMSGSYGRQAFSASKRNATFSNSTDASDFSPGATFNFAQKTFRQLNDLRQRPAERPGNACGPAASGDTSMNFFK